MNEDFEMRDDFGDHEQFRDFALCAIWASEEAQQRAQGRLGSMMIGAARAGR